MARQRATSGPCIVCSCETTEGNRDSGRWHFRCDDGEECAVRRNAGKARPKPEAEIRAKWQAAH